MVGHMYGWHDGWGWWWMAPLMLLWLVALAGVVYAAVRLALRQSPPKPTAGSDAS